MFSVFHPSFLIIAQLFNTISKVHSEKIIPFLQLFVNLSRPFSIILLSNYYSVLILKKFFLQLHHCIIIKRVSCLTSHRNSKHSKQYLYLSFLQPIEKVKPIMSDEFDPSYSIFHILVDFYFILNIPTFSSNASQTQIRSECIFHENTIFLLNSSI